MEQLKYECPKCDELMFVFLRIIPGAGGMGDVDLWECLSCQYEEAAIVVFADWGILDGSIVRIKALLKEAAEKYEPGMMTTQKVSGINPCCDALHEFESSLQRITTTSIAPTLK